MKKKIFRVSFDLDVTKGVEGVIKALRLKGETESKIDENLEKVAVKFKEAISKIIHDEWSSSWQKVENFKCEYAEEED